MQTLEVRRVPSSADLMQAGDYCLIEKREPIKRHVPLPDQPRGFWPKLMAWLRNKKRAYLVVTEPVWPDYDAILVMCPHCSQPITTTKEQKIVNLEPLTIDFPLACAYSRRSPTAPPTIAFEIKDGKIMPA